MLKKSSYGRVCKFLQSRAVAAHIFHQARRKGVKEILGGGLTLVGGVWGGSVTSPSPRLADRHVAVAREANSLAGDRFLSPRAVKVPHLPRTVKPSN